jgi:hypothetical protein
MFTGLGDSDVDDASFFLRQFPLDFALFLLGSSFSSIGFGSLVFLFFGCFFHSCFS